MKLLSVAVPSYNMEKYLPQCLSSLADERLREELEVIVVDDGSKDATAAIAQEYAARWPDIFRVISQDNGGHGAAVNTAMDAATGKYFRIVDADDWVDAGNLPQLLDALRQTDADLVLDEKTEVDAVSGVRTYFPFPEDMPSDRTVSMEALEDECFRRHFSLHTMSVRLSLLREKRVRLLERTFYVDAQYVLQAAAHAASARVLRLGIYYYRVGNAAQSVAHANFVRRYGEHDRVLDACIAFWAAEEYAPDRRAFVAHSVLLLVHTQLNIALIYNENRRAGRAQARLLMDKLLRLQPELARAARRRYGIALLMNLVGIGDREFARIRRFMKRRK